MAFEITWLWSHPCLGLYYVKYSKILAGEPNFFCLFLKISGPYSSQNWKVCQTVRSKLYLKQSKLPPMSLLRHAKWTLSDAPLKYRTAFWEWLYLRHQLT
jgi:hypothetical protein